MKSPAFAPAPLRVMGIDPGLTRMGWGVVDEISGDLRFIAGGTVTTPQGAVPERLGSVFKDIAGLMAEWRPQAVAVEKVFLKMNLQTGVGALQAAGVAMLAAVRSGAEVHEYSPAQIKLSVVGNGSASKDQIGYMVERILGDQACSDTADAADALAIAITHVNFGSIRSLQAAAAGDSQAVRRPPVQFGPKPSPKASR